MKRHESPSEEGVADHELEKVTGGASFGIPPRIIPGELPMPRAPRPLDPRMNPGALRRWNGEE